MSLKSVITKTAGVSAAGDTVIWTPPAGKRFQLLGMLIGIAAASVAGGAGEEISMKDGAAVFIRTGFYLPATALAQAPILIELPNDGYISTTDGNVLSMNLSSAITGGILDVTVWGYER